VQLSVEDVTALARGVTLLGSGGGGQVDVAAVMLRYQMSPHEAGRSGTQPAFPDGRRITVHDPGDLPSDAFVVPVGLAGATSVFVEKLPGGGEFRTAVAAVAEHAGVTPVALIAAEIGGVPGLLVFSAALETGLDVVDADLMGRALPRFDQLTTAARGMPAVPFALADATGQVVMLDGMDAAGVERVVRAIVSETGGWGAVALPPLRVSELGEVASLGMVRRALALGRTHLSLEVSSPPWTVAAALGGRLLASGRVVEVTRHGPVRRFGRGTVAVLDAASGTVLRIEMENEYLLALSDGEVVATTPDVLCVLDRRTGEPVQCDRIRAGGEADVVHLPAAPFWRRGQYIDRVSPRAFGLDADPVLIDGPVL
jgi:DUF917 family protein